jgi:hypothetical protein
MPVVVLVVVIFSSIDEDMVAAGAVLDVVHNLVVPHGV